MQDKKKWGMQLAVFGITFVVAFLVARMIFSKSVNSELNELAGEFNAKTPMMVDRETRLDQIEVSGDTLSYHYTLVNVSKTDSTTDLVGAKRFLMNQSQSNLDTSANMKSFREKNVSLKYHYRDKTGAELLDFKINPTTKK